MSLPAPVSVSPFIKLCRWSLLLLGVGYGAANHSRFSVKEAKVREIEQQHKIVRDAKLAEEKKKASALEKAAIDALSGIKN